MICNDAGSQRPGMTVSRDELVIHGSDDGFRDMLHDMLSVFARLEHMRDRFGTFLGLSGPQYTILAAIRQFQGDKGIGVKELADHLGLSGAFITIETKRLAKLGVIHKKTNPEDQRRVNLSLTSRGVEMLLQLAPLQREVNDTFFEALSAEDFRLLCKIMRSLRQSAGPAAALADYLLDDGKDER